MEENKRISDLFERARTEAPKTSFDDVKGHFLAAGTVTGVGLLAKWAAASLKLKVIIMTSTLITLTISGLLVTSALNSNPAQKETKDQKDVIIPMENLEIIQEDGIKETIFYDDKDQVLEIIVDSSSKLNDEAEASVPNTVSELNTHQLTSSEREINLAPPVTAKTTNSSEGEEEAKERRFVITEKTSTTELEEIQELAEKAGIKMEYNARIKKNIIKRISMTWKLNNENCNSNWQISVTGDDDFRLEVGWKENDKGEAIGFLNDKRYECGDKEVGVLINGEGQRIEIKN